MPDVIEMPYKTKDNNELVNLVTTLYHPRLGGLICLVGDVIGDYSFKRTPCKSEYIDFYRYGYIYFVKNNTFNGVNLPESGGFI